MMGNKKCITNSVFVVPIFRFCTDFFGHVEKKLDKKASVNFKLYGFTYRETNNYNTHIA